MFYVLEITDQLGTHRIISEEPLKRHRSDGSVTIRLVGTFQSIEGASDCVDDYQLGAGKGKKGGSARGRRRPT
jgi:hypothetical protein